jgi:hypothetical protein
LKVRQTLSIIAHTRRLVAGLLELRRNLGDSRFSAVASMFIPNLVLSLALSPLAAIAGLAGWVLTNLATGSTLKKTRY